MKKVLFKSTVIERSSSTEATSMLVRLKMWFEKNWWPLATPIHLSESELFNIHLSKIAENIQVDFEAIFPIVLLVFLQIKLIEKNKKSSNAVKNFCCKFSAPNALFTLKNWKKIKKFKILPQVHNFLFIPPNCLISEILGEGINLPGNCITPKPLVCAG